MKTVEILREAIRVIENVRPEAWRMSAWALPAPEIRCGSIRCALGHIASDSYFIARGLILSAYPNDGTPANIRITRAFPFYSIDGRSYFDHYAFSNMAGIRDDEADNIFYAWGDEPKDTIRKLETLIAKYSM